MRAIPGLEKNGMMNVCCHILATVILQEQSGCDSPTRILPGLVSSTLVGIRDAGLSSRPDPCADLTADVSCTR